LKLILLFASALLLSAQVKPVKSTVCAECHPKIYQTFSKTSMAASSGLSETGSLQESFQKASFTDRQSAFSYSVGRNASGYFFEFQKQHGSASPTRRRLPFFVGSGTAARAFLIAVDGFLYESPVTYYSRTAAWDLSPGYDRYQYPFLTRAIAPGCLACHSSGVQAISGTQNAYASPPFLEGGVSCERCHGPGESHVKSGGLHILNPAKLPPEQRDSICSQCHLSGEVLVPRAGRENQPFVPGEKLSDSRIAFLRVGESSGMKVVSHVENLSQSACKRASGDRLWCGTCHDPHSVPAAAAKAAWFRAKCLTCHQPKDCRSPAADRASNQDDCIACHMPRNPVSDAQHVVYTDHSIPRRPSPRQTMPASADAPLAPFGLKTATARDLGLAYAIVAVREQNPAYRERAFNLLKEAIDKNPEDPLTLSYLADLYKSRSDDSVAFQLYERLMRVDPLESSAPVALGAYQMERGNNPEAIRLWTDALRKSPALLLVRLNLAVALLRTGHPAEARATLEKALEFNPNFQAARDLLAKIPPM
jgi:Tetratricopeptide repeat/Cytochrome c554 and c-prime